MMEEEIHFEFPIESREPYFSRVDLDARAIRTGGVDTLWTALAQPQRSDLRPRHDSLGDAL